MNVKQLKEKIKDVDDNVLVVKPASDHRYVGD